MLRCLLDGAKVSDHRDRQISSGPLAAAAYGLAVMGELWTVDALCLAEVEEIEQSEGRWHRRPVAITGC